MADNMSSSYPYKCRYICVYMGMLVFVQFLLYVCIHVYFLENVYAYNWGFANLLCFLSHFIIFCYSIFLPFVYVLVVNGNP
jgi:hypothetical protein